MINNTYHTGMNFTVYWLHFLPFKALKIFFFIVTFALVSSPSILFTYLMSFVWLKLYT